MAKVDYKSIWQELKEKKINEYIMFQGYLRRHPHKENYKLLVTNIKSTLKRMDKLDGTNEFDNLLDDLRRLHGDDLKQ